MRAPRRGLVVLGIAVGLGACSGSDGDRGELEIERATGAGGALELVVSVVGTVAKNPGLATSGRTVGLVCTDHGGRTTVTGRHPWPFLAEPGFDHPHVHQTAPAPQIRATERCHLTGTRIEVAGEIPALAADAEPSFSRPARIDNPYLPLTRFARCVLAGEEDGARVRVIRTLLPRREPFTVEGRRVETVVIMDRAFEDGELVERTLDYFAQDDGGTVHYFGEDVDNYRNGRVVDHEGSWRYGRDTRKLGVAMPAQPRVGSTWRFEDVPGITIESDRVVARLSSTRIAGRTYRDVLRVREFLRPERVVEYKLYARGIGLIRESPPDGRVDLVSCTR